MVRVLLTTRDASLLQSETLCSLPVRKDYFSFHFLLTHFLRSFSLPSDLKFKVLSVFLESKAGADCCSCVGLLALTSPQRPCSESSWGGLGARCRSTVCTVWLVRAKSSCGRRSQLIRLGLDGHSQGREPEVSVSGRNKVRENLI